MRYAFGTHINTVLKHDAVKTKYSLTYDVDPENGIPNLTEHGVKPEDFIVAASKDEGHKLKYTNIFYKDKLTIDDTEILVLHLLTFQTPILRHKK